jgi:type II secretory pathway pseudopilin PulG
MRPITRPFNSLTRSEGGTFDAAASGTRTLAPLEDKKKSPPCTAALPPRCSEGLRPSVRAVKAPFFKGSGAGRKGGAFPQVTAAEPQPPADSFTPFLRAKMQRQASRVRGPRLVPPRRRPARGYALIVLMIAVTVLAVGLLAVLPSVYQESRREKEKELIFRGNQYARAIFLFHQQFQRYPTSVKELLRTNNMSFLRKAYTDPMTPSGKWRFIHAGPSGAPIDSWTLGVGQSTSPLGQNNPGGQTPGATQGSFGFSQSTGGFGFSQGGTTQSSFGSDQLGFGSSQSSFGSTQSGFGSTQSGFGSNQSGFGQSSFGLGSQPSQPSGTTAGGPTGQSGNGPTDQSGKPRKSPDCAGGKEAGPTSAFFSDNGQPQGAQIIGVASCNNQASIRVWNKYTHYDQWEFMGVNFVTAAVPGGIGQGQNNGASGQGQNNGIAGGGITGGIIGPNQPGQGGLLPQPGSSAQPPGAALPPEATEPTPNIPPDQQPPPDEPPLD